MEYKRKLNILCHSICLPQNIQINEFILHINQSDKYCFYQKEKAEFNQIEDIVSTSR